MGFDPERVLQLRSAMQRAESELDLIRCSDSEAATAMQFVRRVQRDLADLWLPVLQSILSCPVLTDYQPVLLDPNELTTSRLGVLQQLYGWSVVTDPLTAVDQMVTVDQAQALGWTLAHGHISSLVGDAELTWLSATLNSITQQKPLARAFSANMTADGWMQLCNALGDERIGLIATRTIEGSLDATSQQRLSDIDAIFGALGAIVVELRNEPQSVQIATLLSTMHPYAAAMIVQHLQLAANELAEVSAALIARYRLGGWADVQRAGPGTADLLMQAMLDTPGAPTAFVARVAGTPALLFDAAHNSALAQRLVLVATNPTNMSVSQAGTVIPGFVRYLHDSYLRETGFFGQVDPAIAPFAVDLVAPWLLQFTQTHASAWGLHPGEGASLLASVIADDKAFVHLIGQRAAIAAGFTELIASRTDVARHAVEDLAAILGLIDTLARQRAITSAADARQVWDLGFAVIGASTSLLPGGAATTLGSGAALAALRSVLVRHGIAPKGASAIAHDTTYVLDWQTTVAAATVVCATFDQLIRDGRIAVGTPRPPLPDPKSPQPGTSYSTAFSAWLDVAALGQAGVLLDAIKQTIASGHEAERNATDLAA